MKSGKRSVNAEEKLFMVSQWQLIIRKFRKHKLAMVGLMLLIFFYFIAAFCEFFAVQDITKRDTNYIYVPPQKIHFVDSEGRFSLRPFVYGLKMEEDPVTWRKTYVEDTTRKYYINFFTRGDRYKLWGIFDCDLHLMGVKDGPFFLLGTDESGRDMFSRIMYALRVSLTIGLVGVFFTFILGCIFGGIAGYYGGTVDLIFQRVIEFLMSMPSIPLWMALAAAFPKDWSSAQIYFMITIILSLIGWTTLARVVRGKLLELRGEDYVLAAKLAGASDFYIIRKHLIPGFISYLIVNITLSVPSMILAETSLSFLGIGLRPPVVSLGVLLKDAQNINTLALNAWLIYPGLFIVIIVLVFNFLGDGLRDAADPYK